MSARSRRSLTRSRSSKTMVLLSSSRSGLNLLRTPGNSTSMGIMHYIPYTRAKGVSPVARLGVVRCDQRTPLSSSAYLPFLASRRFFKSVENGLIDRLGLSVALRISGR